MYVYNIYAVTDGENGPTVEFLDWCETPEKAIEISNDYQKKVDDYNERNGRVYECSYPQIRFEKRTV